MCYLNLYHRTRFAVLNTDIYRSLFYYLNYSYSYQRLTHLVYFQIYYNSSLYDGLTPLST